MSVTQLGTYRFTCDHPACKAHHMGPRNFTIENVESFDHAWEERPDGWTRDYPFGQNWIDGRIKCPTCPGWNEEN